MTFRGTVITTDSNRLHIVNYQQKRVKQKKNKQLNTPTKIPSRQTKSLGMINKTLTMRNIKTSMTTKTPSLPTKNLRCFVARQILSQIYAFFLA